MRAPQPRPGLRRSAPRPRRRLPCPPAPPHAVELASSLTAASRRQPPADEDDELFYDEDEVGRGAGDAAALEQRFEQMLQMDAGRFADEGDGEEEEEVRAGDG